MPRKLASGLLADSRVISAAAEWVCLKPPPTSRALSVQSRYQVGAFYKQSTRECSLRGVLLLISSEGQLLQRFSGASYTAEDLAGALRRHFLHSRIFLSYYFTIDHPVLDRDDLLQLLRRMKHREWRVRESATRDAIAMGAPVNHAFDALDLQLLSLEQRRRVRHVLEHQGLLGDLVRDNRLGRDVKFLARLQAHPDPAVRRRARRRIGRILPSSGVVGPKELLRRWSAQKDRLYWDVSRGAWMPKSD